MTHIVAFHGPMRSGKDAACLAAIGICQKAGLVAERHGWADKLKLSAVRALGWDPATVEEAIDIANAIKEGGTIRAEIGTEDGVDDGTTITGRQYLQWYGTESHRDVFGSDFWVDALLPNPHGPASAYGLDVEAVAKAQMENRFPGVDVVLNSDTRFPNEARRVLDLGGHVVRIERPGLERSDSHASETPLHPDLVTHTLWNGGDLADLHKGVKEILRNIGVIG